MAAPETTRTPANRAGLDSEWFSTGWPGPSHRLAILTGTPRIRGKAPVCSSGMARRMDVDGRGETGQARACMDEGAGGRRVDIGEVSWWARQTRKSETEMEERERWGREVSMDRNAGDAPVDDPGAEKVRTQILHICMCMCMCGRGTSMNAGVQMPLQAREPAQGRW